MLESGVAGELESVPLEVGGLEESTGVLESGLDGGGFVVSSLGDDFGVDVSGELVTLLLVAGEGLEVSGTAGVSLEFDGGGVEALLLVGGDATSGELETGSLSSAGIEVASGISACSAASEGRLVEPPVLGVEPSPAVLEEFEGIEVESLPEIRGVASPTGLDGLLEVSSGFVTSGPLMGGEVVVVESPPGSAVELLAPPFGRLESVATLSVLDAGGSFKNASDGEGLLAPTPLGAESRGVVVSAGVPEFESVAPLFPGTLEAASLTGRSVLLEAGVAETPESGVLGLSVVDVEFEGVMGELAGPAFVLGPDGDNFFPLPPVTGKSALVVEDPEDGVSLFGKSGVDGEAPV